MGYCLQSTLLWHCAQRLQEKGGNSLEGKEGTAMDVERLCMFKYSSWHLLMSSVT